MLDLTDFRQFFCNCQFCQFYEIFMTHYWNFWDQHWLRVSLSLSLLSKHLFPSVRHSVWWILPVESDRVPPGQRVPPAVLSALPLPLLTDLGLLAEEGRPALALPNQRSLLQPRLLLLHLPRPVQRRLQQGLLVRQPVWNRIMVLVFVLWRPSKFWWFQARENTCKLGLEFW